MYRARIASLIGKITILFVIFCCYLPAQAKYGGCTIQAEMAVQILLHIPRTLHVPAEYSSIQAAIDNCEDGDEVLVADGTYSWAYISGVIHKNKAISVQSENGPENCIIDCEGETGFWFYRTGIVDCRLEGFTFINDAYDLGAIYCSEGSSPTISNCVVTNNRGLAGIRCFSKSNPAISNCIITKNHCRSAGILVGTSSNPKIINCIVSDNLNIGIYCEDSDPAIMNCTITGNWGGIHCESYRRDCSPTINNSILWANSPYEIFLENGASASISYSDIQRGYEGVGNIDVDPCFVQPGYLAPISYWKFDEPGGTTAYDSVGDNDGTIYGAVWTTGQISGALSFDGVNDYVDMRDTVKDYLKTSYTVSVWIKTNTVSANYAFSIIAYRHSTDINPVLFAIGQDKEDIHFAVRDNSLNLAQPVYANAITTNAWYHIAGVREENVLNVYVNGVSGMQDSEAFGEISPDSLIIGATLFGGNPLSNYFNGIIDEVAIYDRALCADEIQQHYKNGLSGQGYPDVNTPDYRLLLGSPCINAGDPDYIAQPGETDVDGLPRVIGGRIDMGAYEFNHTPVADAGPDRTVEAQAPWGATVTLDGSGSSDADSTPGTTDDINDFNWYELDPCDPNADIFLGSGRIIDCNLPFGEHIISLEVVDRSGDFDIDDVNIIVQDTTPPDFNLFVTPTMLWPPTHEMVEITPSWMVSDKCDPTPDVSLVGIEANEGDDIIGDGHTSDDIQIDDDGTIYVRAERSGPGIGRIYTITYQTVDDFGNAAVRSATVGVPHELKFLARIGCRWLWRNHNGHLTEDLNGDGIVNFEDFAIFAENWIR